jgi:hypothetical protein
MNEMDCKIMDYAADFEEFVNICEIAHVGLSNMDNPKKEKCSDYFIRYVWNETERFKALFDDLVNCIYKYKQAGEE